MACDPAILALKIRRGTAYGPLKIYFKDTDDDPIDLTGWGVFAVARPELESPNVLDLDPDITNAATGEVTIEFTDVQTAAFVAGAYNYDLVLENLSSQRVGPYLAGALTVLDINSRE